MLTNNSLFLGAMNLLKHFYVQLSVKEVHDHVLKSPEMYYAAPYGNVESYYYNLEDSVYVLNELLLFQNNNDIDKVVEFLVSVYDIVDKLIPKVNTLFFLSPPNAGKKPEEDDDHEVLEEPLDRD